METRSKDVLIGLFVTLFLTGFIVFVVWVGGAHNSADQRPCDIYFSGAVTGLKVGSPVTYRGVPVGAVQSIDLKPHNLDQIRVRVGIQKDLPLKTSMVASLETQGLTGISMVQISGGKTEDPDLEPSAQSPYPVIPARSSLFERVSGSVPELIESINNLTVSLKTWFSGENQERFSKILEHIENVSGALDPQNPHGDQLVHHLKESIVIFSAALKDFSAASLEVRHLLADNRQGFKEFTVSGLPAFTKFLSEGRETLGAVRRLTESLERSPTRFFHNDPRQGIAVKDHR